jgi:hypothetical protein
MTDRLRDLQTELRRYILEPHAPIAMPIVDTRHTDARARLDIYADAYRVRLIEALDANFPALHIWVGGNEFNAIALAYIDAQPSTHYSIRWFGHRLPTFLRTDPRWKTNLIVCELAQFEWAISEAFDARNADALAADALSSLAPDAWPELRFGMNPSLRRLALRTNAPEMWRALPKLAAQIPTPERGAHPAAWMVWRQELAIYYRKLEVDEAWALDAAAEGQTFADICEGICEWVDAEHVAMRAAGFLRQWTQDGLIVQLKS